MLPEKQDEAFNQFYKSARFNDVLDQKTTLLLHLAIVPPAWYCDRVMRGADLVGRMARRREAGDMASTTRTR